MSELTHAQNHAKALRWQLMSTVSALALLLAVYESGESEAADQDADRPTVWIELGGQFDRLDSPQQALAPSLMMPITRPSLASALNVQNPPTYSLGTEGTISFQPEDSDWVFSATAQYGRANMVRHRHHQTANSPVHLDITYNGKYLKYGSYYPSQHARFADGKAAQSEQHAILDFQVGKDVGVGMFGNHSSSTFSAGIRFAQFISKASVTLRALPDLQYPTAPITGTLLAARPALLAFQYAHIHFHAYTAMLNMDRSFEGVGPSLAWNASMPFAGSPGGAEFTFDWGANAAVLFGRQKVAGHHQTSARTYSKTKWGGGERAGQGGNHAGKFGVVAGHFIGGTQTTTAFHNLAYTNGAISHRNNAADISRMRMVTVPNFGGFAGLSARYSNVKLSLGYRVDFFFGAIDGGIDTAQKENRGFYGPFASVSVGLGG
jgi:iron complex outermembrane receptor protein